MEIDFSALRACRIIKVLTGLSYVPHSSPVINPDKSTTSRKGVKCP